MKIHENSSYVDLGNIKHRILFERIKLDIPQFNLCTAIHNIGIAREFQSNNYDCALMICGYAIHTILNKELTNINISYIREFIDTSHSENGGKSVDCTWPT